MPTRPKTAHTSITDVLDAMHANLPNLVTAKEYLLPDLVGKAFWHSMPTGTRKHLGVEFKDLVLNGGQPVKWCDCKSNNSNVYQLR